MSNVSDYQEQARKNEEKVTRVQNLRAMERLIVGMGGRHAYIAWLQALPEDVKLNGSGGLDQEGMNSIAENEAVYNSVVHAFAQQMGPVLMALAETEVGNAD